MSLEDRRKALIQATVPLLYEHGANVTTSQIAKAAGIAEGTVFRAFKDKQELLGCCVRTALSSNVERGLIEEIPPDAPLVERLTAAVNAVTGYLDRMWSIMSTLKESGFDPWGAEGKPKGPRQEMQRISVAVGALFHPEEDGLRVDPALAARLLLGLVFTNRMQAKGFGGEFAQDDQLVDLFLHGVTGGEK